MNQPAQPQPRSDRQTIVNSANAITALTEFYKYSLASQLNEAQAFEKQVDTLGGQLIAVSQLFNMRVPPEIPPGLPVEHMGQWAQQWLQQNPNALKDDDAMKKIKEAKAVEKK